MQNVGFIIIGDEILCGKTRDINLQNLALVLGEKGYQVGEVRIIPDDEAQIINTVNELRKKYFLVITSGGIGPTHDDITTASVAKAFNVNLQLNEEAKKELASYCKQANLPLNEARLKMAIVPQGATLIYNKHTKAPGFKLQNVCVLAGIPSIFKGMLEELTKTLNQGQKMHTLILKTNKITEGMIATELGIIQKKYQGKVFIGSYPKFDENHKPSLEITFKGINLETLENCKSEVENLFSQI